MQRKFLPIHSPYFSYSILSLLLLTSFVLFVPSVPAASAHPFIVDSTPNISQNAPVGTTEIVVSFSESVDIEFSEIVVLNDKGDRIDNKDLRYYHEDDDLVLAVSTPPLQDGVYTVSTKVLSKVDGHLVPGVILFGVGDVTIDPKLLEQEKQTELLLLPEAASDFPGIVGQTIIVGAAVSALVVWGTQNKRSINKDELVRIEDRHRKRFLQLSSVGLLLILVSNVSVIILQMSRLESGLVESIQTQFGMIWLVRLLITITLFGIWFASNKIKAQRLVQSLMLAAGLALMMTSSISGHGAATESIGAIALDYIHNIVAGVWIGGLIYIVFGLLPVLSKCSDVYKERLCITMIPRFSMMFIISVGIVIVTGPTLLWTLESDVGLITESMFGRLIILKIAIASAMIGMGAFIQYRIQRNAEISYIITTKKNITIHNRLKKTLKIDVILGVSLLLVVALLTNGTLPAGEIRNVEAQQVFTGLVTTQFSDNARFDIEITPFGTGENLITVSTSNTNGTSIPDLDKIKIKVSNPSKGIPPIELDVKEVPSHDSQQTYSGELILAFSGQWLLEIEAQRTQSANEAVRLDVFAKPQLTDLDVTITSHMLPNGTSPLHAAYDYAGGMWFSDALSPRLWKIDINTEEIVEYPFDGESSSFLAYNKYDGNIWFTDSRGGQIGYVDVQNGHVQTIKTPDFKSDAPTSTPRDRAMPFFIEADDNGNIWLTIINKGLLAKFDPNSEEFTTIAISGRDTLPFALAAGHDEKMWYTAIGAGTVGYVSYDNNTITEVIGGNRTLASPEALLVGGDEMDGTLWITEHTGWTIVKYDYVLDTLKRFNVSNPDSSPFGMAFDRYGNVWFAQHTIDSIAVLDPQNGAIREIEIPATTQSVQFIESDDNGNLWFAEQRANKINMISITERPSTYRISDQADSQFLFFDPSDVKYADLVSPLMALGVLATSLFYVRAVHDKQRLDNLFLTFRKGTL